jgi:hypothetical protein
MVGPQGDRMDLLQQLAHLDDGLGRKLCSRLLAVTHGQNHVGSPISHSASSRQEEAFARLLYLPPVMLTLTANHGTYVSFWDPGAWRDGWLLLY